MFLQKTELESQLEKFEEYLEMIDSDNCYFQDEKDAIKANMAEELSQAISIYNKMLNLVEVI